jgi:hypothetical protein
MHSARFSTVSCPAWRPVTSTARRAPCSTTSLVCRPRSVAQGRPVIFVGAGCHLPDGRDLPEWLRDFDELARSVIGRRVCPTVTDPSWQIDDAVAPLPGEIVLNKTSSGPLNSTKLDQTPQSWCELTRGVWPDDSRMRHANRAGAGRPQLPGLRCQRRMHGDERRDARSGAPRLRVRLRAGALDRRHRHDDDHGDSQRGQPTAEQELARDVPTGGE